MRISNNSSNSYLYVISPVTEPSRLGIPTVSRQLQGDVAATTDATLAPCQGESLAGRWLPSVSRVFLFCLMIGNMSCGNAWQCKNVMWGGARYCGFSNFNSRDRCLVCDAPRGFVGKLTPKRSILGGRASVPPPKPPGTPKRKVGAKGQEQEQDEAGKAGGYQKSPMQQAKSKAYQLEKLVEQDPEDEELRMLWEKAKKEVERLRDQEDAQLEAPIRVRKAIDRLTTAKSNEDEQKTVVADLQKQLEDLTAKLQKARVTLEEKQQLREKAAKEHEDAVARCGAGQQQTAEERGETIKPTIEQLVGLSGHLEGDPELQQAFKVIQAGNDKLKKAWDKHHAAEAERKAEAGQQESDQAAMDEDVEDFVEVLDVLNGRKKEATREGAKRLLEAATKAAKKAKCS